MGHPFVNSRSRKIAIKGRPEQSHAADVSAEYLVDLMTLIVNVSVNQGPNLKTSSNVVNDLGSGAKLD